MGPSITIDDDAVTSCVETHQFLWSRIHCIYSRRRSRRTHSWKSCHGDWNRSQILHFRARTVLDATGRLFGLCGWFWAGMKFFDFFREKYFFIKKCFSDPLLYLPCWERTSSKWSQSDEIWWNLKISDTKFKIFEISKNQKFKIAKTLRKSIYLAWLGRLRQVLAPIALRRLGKQLI